MAGLPYRPGLEGSFAGGAGSAGRAPPKFSSAKAKRRSAAAKKVDFAKPEIVSREQLFSDKDVRRSARSRGMHRWLKEGLTATERLRLHRFMKNSMKWQDKKLGDLTARERGELLENFAGKPYHRIKAEREASQNTRSVKVPKSSTNPVTGYRRRGAYDDRPEKGASRRVTRNMKDWAKEGGPSPITRTQARSAKAETIPVRGKPKKHEVVGEITGSKELPPGYPQQRARQNIRKQKVSEKLSAKETARQKARRINYMRNQMIEAAKKHGGKDITHQQSGKKIGSKPLGLKQHMDEQIKAKGPQAVKKQSMVKARAKKEAAKSGRKRSGKTSEWDINERPVGGGPRRRGLYRGDPDF